MKTVAEFNTTLSFGSSASHARIAVTKSGYIHAWLGTPQQPEKVDRWKPENLEAEIERIKSIEPIYLSNYIRETYLSA